MSEFKVSREFAANFAKVVAHYKCPPDEVEEMKAAVGRDRENAAVCYAALAREIDDMHGAYESPDDRRRCTQCKHLSGQACKEAKAVAGKDRYLPALNVLRRCSQFLEK